MDERVAQLAVDYAAAFEPPWWRPLRRRRWKHSQQAVVAYLAIHEALTGEAEPGQSFGVKLSEDP